MPTPSPSTFVDPLLAWYEEHGRHDLPWRERDRTPFEVLVAQVLLQQTTAAAVAGTYEPFVARYPTPAAVVAAPSQEIADRVAPLGLPRRAEYLERTAGRLLARHDGDVPRDVDDLLALHGVGAYTAGSVRAHAHGESAAPVDTNVARVLARFFGVDADETDLAAVADDVVPAHRASDVLYAVLDLGATVCTARSPACESCPLAASCASADELSATDRQATA